MSIWNGITVQEQGQGGERIITDTSVPGGEYVGDCVDFFSYFDENARCHKCKFVFTISTGPQAGKYLVRWAQTGGPTGEKQTKNRQGLASDFMNTLGRLPEFTDEDGIRDRDRVRAGIVGAVCKLKTDPWIGNKGQPMLAVYINDTIQHGGQAQSDPAPLTAGEPDPFRDAGEPPASDPFAAPQLDEPPEPDDDLDPILF